MMMIITDGAPSTVAQTDAGESRGKKRNENTKTNGNNAQTTESNIEVNADK